MTKTLACGPITKVSVAARLQLSAAWPTCERPLRVPAPAKSFGLLALGEREDASPCRRPRAPSALPPVT
jgi:hypothetical protein